GGRKTRDQASHPEEDPSLALSKVTGAANRTPVLDDHSKHNPVAEVADLLKLEVQFLVRVKPVLKEATNRRTALEEGACRPPVKNRILSEAADHRVEITAIRSLRRPAHKLHQVGGRGFLGHRPASIPPDLRRRASRRCSTSVCGVVCPHQNKW